MGLVASIQCDKFINENIVDKLLWEDIMDGDVGEWYQIVVLLEASVWRW